MRRRCRVGNVGLCFRTLEMNRHAITLWFAAGLCVVALGGGGAGCKSNQPRGIKAIDRYVAAVQAYNSGDRDRAVSDLVAATRANPDLIMATLLLGDLYREGGDYTHA